VVFIEPYVQPRILRAIISNGGQADTREIKGMTGLKNTSIWICANQLKNWGILKKKVNVIMESTSSGNPIPRRIVTYMLNEKRREDAQRVINKIPEGWIK